MSNKNVLRPLYENINGNGTTIADEEDIILDPSISSGDAGKIERVKDDESGWEHFDPNLEGKNLIKKVGSIQDATALAGPHDVMIESGYAYVAGKSISAPSGASFAVVDINDPTNPIVTDSDTSLTNVQTVFPTGNYCFVGSDEGVTVFDVSDPSNISLIKTVTDSNLDRINGMEGWGDHLFTASKSGYIHWIDISDAENISITDSVDTTSLGSLNSPHDIDIYNKYVVSVNQDDGASPKVEIYDAIDITNRSVKGSGSWSVAGSYDNSNMNGANRCIVRGSYLYVANNEADSISVLDISDLSSITQEANVATSEAAPDGICVAGDFLYSGNGTSVDLFDISIPANISRINTFADSDLFGSAGSAHDVELWGKYLIVTAQENDSIGVLEVGYVSLPNVQAGNVTSDFAHIGHLAVDKIDVHDFMSLFGSSFMRFAPEEGTWTPTIQGSSSAGSYPSIIDRAKYTKVGNLVFINAKIENITEDSAGSGNLQIAGLPFDVSAAEHIGIRYRDLNIDDAAVEIQGAMNMSDNAIEILELMDNGGFSAKQVSDITSDVTDLFLTGYYFT